MRITRPRATSLSQILINADLDMGAHNIILGAGQTVDGKDVSTLASVLSELGIDADLTMGAHNIILGAGQTVDGKDVSTLDVGDMEKVTYDPNEDGVIAEAQTIAKNTKMKTGTFTNVGAGDLAITGVGFRPDAVLIIGCADIADRVLTVGFSTLAGTNKGFCVFAEGTDGNIDQENTRIAEIVQPASSVVVRAYLKSFDVDGFTLTWDAENSEASTFHYFAWG